MSLKDLKKHKCDECGKNFESVYTNYSWESLWIQLWSLRQKFHQSLQFGNMYTKSSWITQNTGLKLQISAAVWK